MTRCASRLALFLFALMLCCAAPGLARDVRVQWVPDGDTLHLEDGSRVRLIGIDAPEMATDQHPEQYYARQSREFLQGLVEGRSLRLETDEQEEDRFGRILAYVYLPDGRMVNEELVEQGYAFYYPHPHQDRAVQERLLEAQNRAISLRKGFWPRILLLPDPVEGWLGNRRSKRFHHPDSYHGQQISPRNLVPLPTLEQAFRHGYAPARSSSPWPDVEDRPE